LFHLWREASSRLSLEALLHLSLEASFRPSLGV
jgi:hypothetical protein